MDKIRTIVSLDKFFTPFEADDKFIDDDIIKCGELEFKVMHCPGHTRGSSLFIPKGCKHRVTNIDDKEKLIIPEVQLGEQRHVPAPDPDISASNSREN